MANAKKIFVSFDNKLGILFDFTENPMTLNFTNPVRLGYS